MTTLLWTAGLLAFFVVLTVVELFVLWKMGYDVVARLQVTLREGKTGRFFFEAFGVVAFIMVQPALFAWLFSRLSGVVATILANAARNTAALIFRGF